MNKIIKIINKVEKQKTKHKEKENENMREPWNIGKGSYMVVFKRDECSSVLSRFVGVCENFDSTGKSAFWNNETGQMLLVEYKNITGLYPIE